MKKWILLAFSVVLLFGGCSTKKTGNFQLYLTDHPIAGLEHVYVTISGIYLRKEGDEGWTDNILSEPVTYDLLALQGREDLIAEIDLPAGTYTGIKLAISGAEIVVDGQSYMITINPPYEVVIPVVFNVLDGGTTELVLDFDAARSVIGNGGQYSLLPVITVKRIGY